MADEVEEVCVILLCVLKVSLHSVALDRSKLCLYDSKDIGLHYLTYSKLTLAIYIFLPVCRLLDSSEAEELMKTS